MNRNKMMLILPAVTGVLLIAGCNAHADGQPTTPPPTVAEPPTTLPAPTVTEPLTKIPAPMLAPLAARQSAAKLLKAADDQLRNDFEQGASLSGLSQTTWWTEAHNGEAFPVYVVKVTQRAFASADKSFDATNEPQSISDWQGGGTLLPDLTVWYQSDRGQGQNPALKKQVETDFDQLDSLVQAVEAGK